MRYATSMNLMRTSLFVLLILIFGSACRVRFPTYAEQQHLLANDAFPAGPPAWMAAPLSASQSGSGGALSAALIPQVYSDGVGEIETLSAGNSALTQPSQRDLPTGSAMLPSSASEEKISPIDRILQSCPGVEREVSDALRTIERNSRIRKYEALTKRCPASHDLWLWLGKDYQQSEKPVEAARCFERVLILDAGNEEAASLLSDVRQRL